MSCSPFLELFSSLYGELLLILQDPEGNLFEESGPSRDRVAKRVTICAALNGAAVTHPSPPMPNRTVQLTRSSTFLRGQKSGFYMEFFGILNVGP